MTVHRYTDGLPNGRNGGEVEVKSRLSLAQVKVVISILGVPQSISIVITRVQGVSASRMERSSQHDRERPLPKENLCFRTQPSGRV